MIADMHNHTTASNDSVADPRAGSSASPPAVWNSRRRQSTTGSRRSPRISRPSTSFPSSILRASIELSGRPGPGALNHHNAFPLQVREGPRVAAPLRRTRTPRSRSAGSFHHDDDSEKFVQQNHPDVGWLYFDRNRDGKLDGGFGTRAVHPCDGNQPRHRGALEVSGGGRDRRKRGRGFRWLQMLNQGDRIYGTANSDAHATGFNNGSIFTYMKSEHRRPRPARSPRAGPGRRRPAMMVMSNGPFLDVALDGVPPGGDVSLVGAATLKVNVRCADWIDIDRVQVLVNGRPDPALNFTRARASAGFPVGHGTASGSRGRSHSI